VVIKASIEVKANLSSLIKNDKKPFENGEIVKMKWIRFPFSEKTVNKLVVKKRVRIEVRNEISKFFSLIIFLIINKAKTRKTVCRL